MLSNVQIITKDDGTRVAIAFGYSADPLLADETHPNFKRIVEQWLNDDAGGFADLFDIPKAITKAFSRLSQRVIVKDGAVFFDGDEAHGHVIDAILSFMDAGEDVTPLVAFYEKLTTNPLGNVQDGIFSWITGQKAEGNFTITQDGNVLGYKAVTTAAPGWRKDAGDIVYRPSHPSYNGDVVNDEVVPSGEYIEQIIGDVVEMPRSQVLNKPSVACGDGLHIGTYAYAKDFTGDTVLLVEFDPRDVVSLPDRNSDWKLRVCRYKVVGVADGPLEVPLFITEAPAPASAFDGDERFTDDDLDMTDLDDAVQEAEAALAEAEDYLEEIDSDLSLSDEEYEEAFRVAEIDVEDAKFALGEAREKRSHGRGGATSQAAKGRGLNPAQDPTTGQFVAGRPGSARDTSTGRFA